MVPFSSLVVRVIAVPHASTRVCATVCLFAVCRAGLALLPDGVTLISGGRDQVVLVWDLKKKKITKTIAVFESVESVTYVPRDAEFEPRNHLKGDEDQIITAGDKGELRVWNLPSGECVHTEKAPAPITNCFLDSRTGRLVASTQDQMILFFDQTTLKRTKQIMGSYDEVIDVKLIGETQSHVAIATNMEYIQLLSIDTLDSALLPGHTDIVLTLAVSSDGLVMASGSKDNTVRLWGADDEGIWRCIGEGKGHAGNVSAVALPQKKVGFVISGSKDCTVKYWHVTPNIIAKSSQEMQQLSAKYTRKAHDKELNCITLAPNDKLFVTGGQDRLAKLWRTEDGELVGTLRGHKRGVWDAQFSTVDQVVATASGDATVKIWAVASMSCVKTFEGHESSVLRVRFLTRGTQLLTSGSDGLMKLWNIKKNEEIKTIDAHDGRVWALSVSNDEERVVTGAQDGSVVIWRDSTKEELAEKYAEEERIVVLSQDLANLLSKNKYKEAAELALELKRPYEMLKIVEKMLLESNSNELLTSLVEELSLEQAGLLLEYSRDWNTDARHVAAAQTTLHVVLHTTSIAELAKLPHIGAVVSSLIAYSERHFKRFAKLQQNSKLVDFAYISLKPAERVLDLATVPQDVPAVEAAVSVEAENDEGENATPSSTKRKGMLAFHCACLPSNLRCKHSLLHIQFNLCERFDHMNDHAMPAVFPCVRFVCEQVAEQGARGRKRKPLHRIEGFV